MSSTGASSTAATSADGHHEKTAPSSSHGPPPSDAPRGRSDDDAEPDDGPEDAASSGADGGSALARRPTSFQPAHALRFGLEVIARDDATGAVTSALCLFCKHFGREPKPGAKRRATTNFKYFKGTFRTDQYVQHHRLQHPVKWAAYEAASPKDKQVFFPRHVIPVDREVSLAAAAVAKRRKKQTSPGRFAPTMAAIKGYILSQSELIESIGHPPATHAADETVIVARWLTERRVRVRKLLDDRQPSCRPPDEWWLSLAIFDWLADSTQHCLEQVSLACSSSWTQQIQFIMALVVVVEEAFHVHATAAETQQSDDSAMPASSSPPRSPDITARGVREFIPELGSFVAGLLTTLNQAGDLEPVLRTISDATTAFLWTLRDGLEHAKGCSEFEPLSSTPVQVYPHELAQLSGKEFAALVESAWPRLQAMHSDEQRDALEQEHQALKRAAREKDFLSALEDAATAQNIPADTPAETFTRAWGLTDGRFRGLHAFAGGLATLRFSCDSRATGASTTRHVNVVALDEAWTLDAQAPLHAAQCGSLERAIGSDMY
ncbi:hypothetical protein P43SY_000056 [Pythium insidiosum]|uniref:Uncharacterized protein n=1 Tax=Pythium insidiosum TaxID=114742 RepID=A0AAD5Q511_PYTIN|nr:hypothetical protein P43SY_000056 [Pythium insidiosum]